MHFLAAGPVDADALTASSEHDRSAWCGEEEALERLDHEELKRAVVRAADALARASAG